MTMNMTIESIKSACNRVPTSVKATVLVGGVVIAIPCAVSLALHPLGWTATGVKAGSAASALHSAIGGTIVKGSYFSLAQKIGAIGVLGALL